MREALSYAMRAMGRTGIAALNHVRISAKDNAVSFIGTDMHIVARASCPAAVQDAGVCLADAASLSAAISHLSGAVSVVLADQLKVSSGRFAAIVPTTDDAFPKVQPSGEFTEIIGGVDAIAEASGFADQSQGHTWRSGVVFSDGYAFALNGVRFIRKPVPGGDGQIISGAHGAIIAKAGGRLFLSGTHWKVEGDGRATSGPLIAEQYADWKRLLSGLAPTCVVDADDLIRVCNRAHMGMSSDLLISCDGTQISAKGERFANPSQSAEDACRADGAEFCALVNAKEFIAALAVHAGRVVNMSGGALKISMESGDGDMTAVAVLRDHRTSLPETKVAA